MAEKLTRPQTIEEFQNMFTCIYGDAHKRYNTEGLMLKLAGAISRTSEASRKERFDLLPSAIARVCMWWFAVAGRLDINMQDALWDKYPSICPYCLHSKDCSCGVEHPTDVSEEDKRKELRRHRFESEKEPRTLADHQLLHGRLYELQNQRIFTIQIVAHLSEEDGEVGEAFLEEGIAEVREEMADVASWMFAVANRRKFDLAEAVWQLYPYECEKCHKTACECVRRKD